MRRAFDAALAAVDARGATAAVLRARPVTGPAFVIALGKAALAMTAGVLDTTEVVRGIVVAPRGSPSSAMPPEIEVLRGSHPIPDADVAVRGAALLAFAAHVPPDATAIVLISGGGSALVDAPVPGMTTDALADITRRLLASGARIDELNALRVALSDLKGGGLARAIAGRARAIVVSDVVLARPYVVASGPMSPWGRPHPRVVARRPHIAAVLTDAERALFERWRGRDGARATLEVAADNERAVQAAIAAMKSEGRHVVRGPTLEGEARDTGRAWARLTRYARVDGIVAGGETVVTVRGPGRGGRNQEMALAALEAGITGTLLCAGTDGIDGPTDAAGAIVDTRTRELVTREAMQRALRDNDAYAVLDGAGALLRTGPTGTNVADLAIWTR